MESIAAKAIRDGVLDATIDHATGTLVSKEQGDVYATLEPGAAFHKRITFCLNLHNDAVKAMSYPFDAHKDQVSPSPSPSPNPNPNQGGGEERAAPAGHRLRARLRGQG